MIKNRPINFLSQTTVLLLLFIVLPLLFENPNGYAKPEYPPPWRPWGVTGVQKLVAVLVEFSDKIHSSDTSLIRDRLFSMAEYFSNVSFGKISVDIAFFDDHWERLNNTMAFYGQDLNGTRDINGLEFIIDSVKAWNRFVNFSNYDSLLVIHAGEDQSSRPEDKELLWRWNFGYLGRTSKRTIMVNSEALSFWGLSYDSEFEEWGLIAHEFAHSLGLPDLYVDNKSLSFDKFSLMARGDRNGIPEGTSPALLDGFSMQLLGWLDPVMVTLNSTKSVVQMKPLGFTSPTLLKIPLSEFEYYMIELRENVGYDKFTVSSPSVVVYFINEMIGSSNGVATILTGGVVKEGSIYSDAARNIFVSLISFDPSTHLATIGLSAQLIYVDIEIPSSPECFFTVVGKIRVFDSNNEPIWGIPLNVSVGEKHHFLLTTDSSGNADFQLIFELSDLGNHWITVSSPYMLAGKTQKAVSVVFPWASLFIALLLVSFAMTSFYIVRNRSRSKRITRY